jgi:hypothetical protein
MRITVNSLHDFLKNLESSTSVVSCVHMDVSKNDIDPNGVKSSVILQASCLIYAAEEQFLLQCGVDCGYDLNTGDGHTVGSDQGADLAGHLERYCTAHSITLLPGVLDF